MSDIQKETVCTETHLFWTSETKCIENASHRAVFFFSGLSFGESARWRCRLHSSW